jgi:signal transduction histidine kinase
MQIVIFIIIGFFLIYLLKRNMDKNFTEESFLSIVNHTFRTPLTRIKWMSESLEQDMPRKEQLEITSNLKNSVNRLLEIVDILAGIKDIKNTSAYDLKAVSIREILEESIKKYHLSLQDKKITLSMPSFIKLPLISIDTKKISLVINIVIENAILYSKENGHIKIESEMKNNHLILKIEDNGIGLSQKDKSNLFKRFYRGDRAVKMNTDGMGLGLYIAKEIIHRHRGQIKAYSKGIDQGTTLYITLPTN